MRALAEVARTVGLGDFLFLGRGEVSTGGRDKDSILADTMEAVIGSVFVSAGLPPAAALIHHLLDPMIAEAAGMGAGLDWKTSLQELCSQQSLGTPEYRVDDDGPEHAKTFFAEVLVGGEVLGSGTGRTKKDAEQQSAAQAWKAIGAAAADA